jgi:2-polyprenyl-3-methyl-5-hydroxy-6-metoxy-1,4-benzoquinol methylase
MFALLKDISPFRRYGLSTTPAELENPVSQGCTARQMRGPIYERICTAIGELPGTHRKQWEFCYIYRVLEQAGMLEPGKRGLGLGVGREPLVAAFARQGARILATDMAPDEASQNGWADTAQHAWGKDALNERNLCPPDMFDALVDFDVVDMNAMPDTLGQFDFVWSACAFEHLGSIRQGHAFIMNAARLLKPGGISIHTTEMNCSSNRKTLDNAATVLFRRRLPAHGATVGARRI